MQQLTIPGEAMSQRTRCSAYIASIRTELLVQPWLRTDHARISPCILLASKGEMPSRGIKDPASTHAEDDEADASLDTEEFAEPDGTS